MNDFTHKVDITAKLKDAGITPTQQRVDIAQILFAREQHLSAEQVMNIVNAENPVVSKATVYNTLGLFADKGLLREVIVDPTKVFYDSNITEHHHIYNVDSGLLTDVAKSRVSLEDLPELPYGTEVAGVDVIIRVRDK